MATLDLYTSTRRTRLRRQQRQRSRDRGVIVGLVLLIGVLLIVGLVLLTCGAPAPGALTPPGPIR